MTQPKPPIFAIVRGHDVLQMFHLEDVAALNASHNYDSSVVRYEPAVPKCGTCNHHADAYSCRHIEGLRIARPDDYCSNHSEAAR